MADSKDKFPPSADYDDQDPFAELTRIMGFDPRAEQNQAPLRASREFVDTERDEPSFDEDADYAPVDEQLAVFDGRGEQDDAQDAATGSDIFADFPLEDEAGASLELDLGSELDRAFSAGFHIEDAPADIAEPALEDELDDDPLAGWSMPSVTPPAPAAVEPVVPAVVATAAAVSAAVAQPRAEIRSPFAYSATRIGNSLVGGRTLETPVVAAPVTAAPAEPEAEEPAFEDEAAFEDETALDDPTAWEFDEQELPAVEDEPQLQAVEDFAADEVEPQALPADDLSLEDELTALLGGHGGDSEPPAFGYAAPAAVAAVAAAAPAFRSTPVSAQPQQAIADPVFDDFDTVDIEDAARPVQDDLDLPELPAEEEAIAAPAFDDLASELEGAFDSFDDNRAAPLAAAGGAAAGYGYATSAAADGKAADVNEFDSYFDEADGYRAGEYDDGRYQEALPADEDLDDYDDAYGDRDDLPPAGVARRPVAEGGRRTVVIAAAIAAVALIGGVGAFAMFAGGDGDGEPVLVAADSDPVKVRPENPGGTVVPNQDSQAYRRVSGADANGTTSQEELITTAEEPVDVAERTAEPRVIAPGIIEADGPTVGDDTALPGVDTDALAGQPKFDERIENVEDLVASASAEPIAVEPRRVRTMVVRPDGTLVPREDPAPAAAEPATGEQVAAVTPTQPGATPVLPGQRPPPCRRAARRASIRFRPASATVRTRSCRRA